MALAAMAHRCGREGTHRHTRKRGAVYFAAPGFDVSRGSRPFGARSVIRRGPHASSFRQSPLATWVQAIRPGAEMSGAQHISPACLPVMTFARQCDRAAVAAARNVDHRGATGLAQYLRGELSVK